MTSRYHGGAQARSGVEALTVDEHDADPSPSRSRRKHGTSGGKGGGGSGRARQVRVRLSDEQIERVDQLADELKRELLRSISRAALMRALVATSVQAVDREAIVKHLTEDPVRHGREPGKGRAGVKSRKEKARRA